jgi:ribose/xylose/arabinose/galactoside ABC-type transport system permease subunit
MNQPVASAGGRIGTMPGGLGSPRRNIRQIITLVRVAAVLALAVVALSTPGFTATPSVLALLTTMSFIGCVAVAMTLVTISGNIMAFCFGATAAATTLVFASTVPFGLAVAVIAALAFGGAVTAAQGLVIGTLRANPIIVSIATLALIVGVAQTFKEGQSIYLERGGPQDALKGKLAGLPIEFVLFVAVAAIGQFLLTFTRFGRNVYMTGSSLRAAEAAGIRTWRTVAGTYLWAGMFVAVPGIMLAARYNSASMDYGAGYDYDAIAAVLVGGTPIHGGEGSVVRTIIGVVVIAVVQVIVLLHGIRQEWQYLITGLIVLFVVMLHTAGSRK